ncbi:hypothetical protein BB559_000019 [Furculomyces boomerangus]|uniref:AD domain-containing protein n=2 Tax=Harpellales TaxID=61421 RepID=A0A2T9Z4Q4_9FUNG|nr:hypothetical protein BB559_000641 [Furculomyces boomerangus]PVV00215.1 hypothetical protein BB559_000019 [Furculomyces boomerangus]PWA03513.1 hypothetical protein BB558_000329 [Smittium angustum]PWA03728.1 hypothetical protein BB558_000110 [Smittium angustum]
MNYRAAASRHLQKDETRNVGNHQNSFTEPQPPKTSQPSFTKPSSTNPNSYTQNTPNQKIDRRDSRDDSNIWIQVTKDKKKYGNKPENLDQRKKSTDDPKAKNQNINNGRTHSGSGRYNKLENQHRVSSKSTSPTILSHDYLYKTVGNLVEIKLVGNRTILGKVFCYDSNTGFLVIMSNCESDTSISSKNQKTVNIAPEPILNKAKTNAVNSIHIQSIKIISNKVDDSSSNFINSLSKLSLPTPKALPIEKLKLAHNKALENAKAQSLRIGVGVTKEAQNIFDALSKTLPCRWVGDKIAVLDEVIIEPPYGILNCRSAASAAATLDRIKKVLHGEKQRLASLEDINKI